MTFHVAPCLEDHLHRMSFENDPAGAEVRKAGFEPV
jgi:hypothetical protein